MTIRVRVLRPVAGPDYSYTRGALVDLVETEAAAWISGNLAELADQPQGATEVVEQSGPEATTDDQAPTTPVSEPETPEQAAQEKVPGAPKPPTSTDKPKPATQKQTATRSTARKRPAAKRPTKGSEGG